MAIKFPKINEYISLIESRIAKRNERGLEKAALFAASQMDLAFENEGERRDNKSTRWERTSRAALMARKSYPSGGGKTGKKGFTKAQAQFLFSAPTLQDTGKMRASIGIESKMQPNDITFYIGAGVNYVKTAEEGGTISVKGQTYDVPERPFQFMTVGEADQAARIIEKELANA